MPKTKLQNEQIKLERYNHIIDVSIVIFAFRYYGSVSVDMITKEANCSHGLFYHYFKNKEDLFHQMMDKIIDGVELWLTPIPLEHQPAKYSLIDILKMFTNGLKGDNDIFACTTYLLLNLYFKSSLPKPPEIKGSNSIRRQPFFKIVTYLIEKGQEEGGIVDGNVRELTIALLSLMKGLSYNRAVLGHEKFICPSPEILTRLLIK